MPYVQSCMKLIFFGTVVTVRNEFDCCTGRLQSVNRRSNAVSADQRRAERCLPAGCCCSGHPRHVLHAALRHIRVSERRVRPRHGSGCPSSGANWRGARSAGGVDHCRSGHSYSGPATVGSSVPVDVSAVATLHCERSECDRRRQDWRQAQTYAAAAAADALCASGDEEVARKR